MKDKTPTSNTIDFIANEARRYYMVDDNILTQYILKEGLRKFGEKDCKATMKELHQMLISEVFKCCSTTTARDLLIEATL